MDLNDSRCLVAGATGELGQRITTALASAGGRLALAGRNEQTLERLAADFDAPTARFEATDADSCRAAVDGLAAALGGLDVMVALPGAAAFGPAGEVDQTLVAEVFQVNALAPIALIDAAIGHMEPGGAIVGTSAVVADYPTAGIAHYSAAKAALSAYLSAIRHEQRRVKVSVLDVRPPHLATGFSDRPLTGTAPKLPEPLDPDELVTAVLSALADDRREVRWDLQHRSLAVG